MGQITFVGSGGVEWHEAAERRLLGRPKPEDTPGLLRPVGRNAATSGRVWFA